MTPAAADTRRTRPAPLTRAAALLAPLLLAACVGYATPERTVLWTPVGTYTSEPVPEDP